MCLNAFCTEPAIFGCLKAFQGDAWSTETPWIMITKEASMFSGCPTCKFLQALQASIPREERATYSSLGLCLVVAAC